MTLTRPMVALRALFVSAARAGVPVEGAARVVEGLLLPRGPWSVRELLR